MYTVCKLFKQSSFFHKQRPSSDPSCPASCHLASGVLSCVMPCRKPDPRHPIGSPRPDPNDLSTFEDQPESLLEVSGSSVVLCYV